MVSAQKIGLRRVVVVAAVAAFVFMPFVAVLAAATHSVDRFTPPYASSFGYAEQVSRSGSATSTQWQMHNYWSGDQYTYVYTRSWEWRGSVDAYALAGMRSECFSLPSGTYTFIFTNRVSGEAQTLWYQTWWGRGWAFGHLSFRARLWTCGGVALSDYSIHTFYEPVLPTWSPVKWDNHVIGWGFTTSLAAGSYTFEHLLYSYHLSGTAGYATSSSRADVTASLLSVSIYRA